MTTSTSVAIIAAIGIASRTDTAAEEDSRSRSPRRARRAGEPDGVAHDARRDDVVLELAQDEHGDPAPSATPHPAVSPTPTARTPAASGPTIGTSSTMPANAPTRSQYGTPSSQNASERRRRHDDDEQALAAHEGAELHVDQHPRVARHAPRGCAAPATARGRSRCRARRSSTRRPRTRSRMPTSDLERASS